MGVRRAAVFVGARDFSPSSLEFSGLKSRAPKDLSPYKSPFLLNIEAWRVQSCVENPGDCEIFGMQADFLRVKYDFLLDSCVCHDRLGKVRHFTF